MARRLTGEQLRDALVKNGAHWQYAKAVEFIASDCPGKKIPVQLGAYQATVRFFRRSGRFALLPDAEWNRAARRGAS